MALAASSSSLSVRAPSPMSIALAQTQLSSKPMPFSSTFFKLAAPRCSSGSTEPSPSSSIRYTSRPWYGPIPRRTFDPPSPEIGRQWIEADEPHASQEKFTVVSYNILSDKYAFKHRDMYSNVPYLQLKWVCRKHVICKELISWNPDIICLQEVDRYFELSEILEKAGYSGHYKRRTGDAVDGCATFWRANEFRLLEAENIEFKGFGLRDNVAQLSVFEMCKDGSKRLVVGNIHVLYYPSRGDVKLGQIRHLSSRARFLSEKWDDIPVLLAGDFNITPQSAIYQFLSTSKLDIMSYNRRDLSGQKSRQPAQVFGEKSHSGNSMFLTNCCLPSGWTSEEVKTAGGTAESKVIVHPLKLRSSYATIQGSAKTRDSLGEPSATSYHSKFIGTVDYIWYSKGLVPTKVLDTLPIDILQKTGGLPSKKVGSDHLALVAEFAFTQDSDVDIAL